jgi:nucleotide-binding universal stress UspA family protein
MKKVIVPLDLSPENFKVFPYLKLFPKDETEFIFVHVWQTTFWSKQHELKLNNQELLDSLKNHSELQGLNIKTVWLESNQPVAITLNQLITNEKADLVLMVVKQKDQLDKMILGTEATKIIQNSQIPILVVPRRIEKVQFLKSVFFTDASPASIYAFGLLRPYLEFFQSEIKIVKVNTPSDFLSTREFLAYQNAIHEQTNQVRYTFEIYSDYEVEKGILDYAFDYNIDLIVLATHGRKGLSLMLNGSVSEEIICASFKPVLLCKIPTSS